MALLAAALLGGCRPSEAERSLRAAESLMESRPDSALTLLRAIDGSRLSGKPRARHALLLSQAYDKNYIDLTSDSLISIAVDFYDNSSDNRRRMLALHYRAAVNRNAGFYERALADELEAHDLAIALNDTLNLCRIEAQIAGFFNYSYNMEEAIKWEKSALRRAKAMNHQKWVSNGYYNIANYYDGLGDFGRAKNYADSAAMRFGLDADIQDLFYRVNIGLENYDAADSIYRQMLADGITPSLQISAMQALIPDTSMHLNVDMESCPTLEQCYTTEDSIACYFIRSQLASKAGVLNSALSNLHAATDMQDHLIMRLNLQSLQKVKADHESRKAVKLKHALQEKKKVTWLMAIICLLVIISSFFAFRYVSSRNRNKRLALEVNLRLLSDEMSQIKTELAQSREAFDASRQEFSTLYGDASDLNGELELFRQQSAIALLGKFAWVEKLGNMYLDADMSSSKEQNLYRKVAGSMSATNLRKLTDEMTAELARYGDGIVDKINELDLAPSEKQVLLYTLAGFSVRIICMLTGKSNNAIYSIKKRLKLKLQKAESSLATELLARL